jgi:large subunit ribosomal protein L3
MIQGLIGRKLGMTQVYGADGTMVPVTVIEAGPCVVTQIKTLENDGYEAVQLGFGMAKKLTAAEKGHLKGLGQLRHLKEFEAEDLASLEVGQKLDASVFAEEELIDVTATSKGKGFAGVVKRYHFRGGPKTHGQSDRHRAPGAIGSTTTPGRVLKGQRMAGRMGGKQVTVKRLRVVRVDADRSLLLVQGGVPGPNSGIVLIRKSELPA